MRVLHVFFDLQVEPRVAGGNVELEGPIEHTLDPFRAATSTPFLVAGRMLPQQQKQQ